MSCIQNRKLPFIASKKNDDTIEIQIIKDSDFTKWLKNQPKSLNTYTTQQGFGAKAKDNKILFQYSNKGALNQIYIITKQEISTDDFANLSAKIQNTLAPTFIKKARFQIKCLKLEENDIFNACLGWGLQAYTFGQYKSEKSKPVPTLLWPEKIDKKRVESFLHAAFIVRDLINTPANDLGPLEIEKEIKALAKQHKARVSVIADKKLLDNNFPLIYTVGQAAAKNRRPRLVDMRWGNRKHPKITLVGKGVVFDTGGLNIKPTPYMAHMKKDMGGAAHAIALATMIVRLNLPVYLQLIIPTVENAIAGDAFRPGDIIKSRKGHFVENTNTDAEGRLILADALTYACEGKPDLLIDFATLTGSARAALGQEIPAMFATQDKTGQTLQERSFELNDPLWRMPLYGAYNKHIENSNGDLVNSAGLPGDLIYSALFLQKFVENKTDWVHLDLFAWESAGKAGRTKGGAEMSLHTLIDYLEDRYTK